jgi:putative AlgH/UPF0301 family transcriptional regulator
MAAEWRRSKVLTTGGPVVKNLPLVLLCMRGSPSRRGYLRWRVCQRRSRRVREVLKKAGKRNRARGYAGYAAGGPGQLDRGQIRKYIFSA